MVSDEFNIIDNHKILTIENAETFKPYFESVMPSFLDKTGTVQTGKINLSNKHKIAE